MRNDYDVLIIGGGLVGASLACALSGQGLHTALVEARPLVTEPHPRADERVLALAYGTQRVFASLDLWQHFTDATPIRQIHISDRGQAGFARLEAAELGVPALGYVVPARSIGLALGERLAQLPDVDLLCPAELTTVTVAPDQVQALLQLPDGPRTVSARLLVAADGAQSPVRQQLAIDALRWDYEQTAIIANVTPEQPHRNIAFERFTDSGPLALLPLGDQRCALVWTVASAQADAVLALDDATFLARLQQRFGERLGRFLHVGQRQAYPLYLLKSREHMRPRVAVIGNAAHTLHPIAGQGFNLGVRDVAALAEVICDAQHSGRDLGAVGTLRQYADWRRWDQRRTIAFTDGLNRLFTNPLAPVRLARNLGLIAFDLLPPAKRLLARQTMGLTGRLPRLVRGLPLTGTG